jgi:hypothetical protein
VTVPVPSDVATHTFIVLASYYEVHDGSLHLYSSNSTRVAVFPTGWLACIAEEPQQ